MYMLACFVYVQRSQYYVTGRHFDVSMELDVRISQWGSSTTPADVRLSL
jgi:hypothetical protein